MYYLFDPSPDNPPDLSYFKQLGDKSCFWDASMLTDLIRNNSSAPMTKNRYGVMLLMKDTNEETPPQIYSFIIYDHDIAKDKFDIVQMGLSDNLKEDQLNLQALFTLLKRALPRETISLKVPESQSSLLSALNVPNMQFHVERDGYTKHSPNSSKAPLLSEDAFVAQIKPKRLEEINFRQFYAMLPSEQIQSALRKIRDITGVEWRIGKLDKDGRAEPVDIKTNQMESLPIDGTYALFTVSKIQSALDNAAIALDELFANPDEEFDVIIDENSIAQQIRIPINQKNLFQILKAPAAVSEGAEDFSPADTKSRFHPERYWRDMTTEEAARHETRRRSR
jgi:hypothetical protein